VSEQTGGRCGRRGRGRARGGHCWFVSEVCTRAVTVGEEGGAVATGDEDRGGAVQWRRYFPSLATSLSVIGS
jgi:hypothetical protein